MQELVESIRIAVAEGATAEQRAAGAHACRAILAALGAEAGKPIGVPSAPPPRPLSGLSLDQLLELLIARLTPVAASQEAPQSAAPATRGLRIATAHAPRMPLRPTANVTRPKR